MPYHVELAREEDGRYIAHVLELPGCHAYGDSEEEAVANALALADAIRIERAKHGE